MSEQDIQRKITNYLKKQGCWVVKTITCNIDGVPDVIACKPDGKFIAIEVKTPRGKVEPLQQYQINKINKVGGVAVVARSLEDVTALF